jgi:hypothetical protein
MASWSSLGKLGDGKSRECIPAVHAPCMFPFGGRAQLRELTIFTRTSVIASG